VPRDRRCPPRSTQAARLSSQHRALAVSFAPGTLALVPRVRRLAMRLLDVPDGAVSARDRVAVSAVLGTIVLSGLTLLSMRLREGVVSVNSEGRSLNSCGPGT
jgi:hypothetical protein